MLSFWFALFVFGVSMTTYGIVAKRALGRREELAGPEQD